MGGGGDFTGQGPTDIYLNPCIHVHTFRVPKIKKYISQFLNMRALIRITSVMLL